MGGDHTSNQKPPRKPWDEYFLDLCELVGSRATCPRASVGCVIVHDKRVVSTGYNGSLPGRPHCDDIGCLMHENHCVRTIHAEANAIAQMLAKEVPNEGTLYCNYRPCVNCMKLIVCYTDIQRVVYRMTYGSVPDLGWGIEVVQCSSTSQTS